MDIWNEYSVNSILNKLFNCFAIKKRSRIFDFNLNNPLGGGGERVDIFISDKMNISEMDIYQLSHLRRYECASDYLPVNTLCADLACGTGYGSVLLSKKNPETDLFIWACAATIMKNEKTNAKNLFI